jgi:hypothetical protein
VLLAALVVGNPERSDLFGSVCPDWLLPIAHDPISRVKSPLLCHAAVVHSCPQTNWPYGRTPFS